VRVGIAQQTVIRLSKRYAEEFHHVHLPKLTCRNLSSLDAMSRGRAVNNVSSAVRLFIPPHQAAFSGSVDTVTGASQSN
jgi:hypothetical protein